MLFGTGGQLVEVFKDRALALPPLNSTLARRLMEQTRVFTALKGVRGRPPVDIAALEELLVRFSQLIVEQRWIKEIDINPLLASPERLLALDARVVVHGLDMQEEDLPRSAIRPYPQQLVVPLGNEGRQGSRDSSHPARRRTAVDQISREALGAQRVPAVFPAVEADPAGGARTAVAHLLHRLRPRNGAGGGASRTTKASRRFSRSAG